MFDLINGKVEIDPDLMAYPPIRELWERDLSSEKSEAFAYLSYIFLFYNPKSSYYKGYPPSVRGIKIVEAFFPDQLKTGEFYQDKIFLQACKVYQESLNLSTMRGVLDFGKQTLYDIQQSLMSQKTKTGTKLNDMRKLNEALEQIARTEKLIEQDEKDKNVKGNRKLKDRERA
jgi:hypothetical protein